ncbi:hypothetical protein IEQ34_005281 [Dendrobium chrysotoxum]|uniref:F-box domain-containing protein n=1 Tax=Dendrobium chrysotoxum TaxID=161865 RepID=A0AAV7HB16_DENCH|nr:hypothetical protein IEQ34_005281 [Dendrobium chrysotoxum]
MAWSALPIDLLHCIASQLPIIDYLRFSVVCTSWNSVLSNDISNRIQCRPSPWLLLPNEAGEASNTLTFRDFTIKEEEVGVSCHRRFSSLDSYITNRRCFGSKDGWLMTLDKEDLQPHLFNPLTKTEISLPSLFTIPKDQGQMIKPQYGLDGSIRFFCNEIYSYFSTDEEGLRDIYFQKIIISSNDLLGTTIAIYGRTKSLALARPGDQTWVLGPQLSLYAMMHADQFEDVYYYKEDKRFYTITHFSMVLAFDLNGQNIELICPATQDPCLHTKNIDYMYYIAFLSGALVKIERVIDTTERKINNSWKVKTVGIFVSKFVPTAVASCSSSHWIPIKDLGGCSLFVGCNQTFSLHHTVAPGIRPNYIYFADHLSDMLPEYIDRDAGLFIFTLNNFSISWTQIHSLIGPLQFDLLHRISSHLSIVDLVRLSVVCTSWNFTPANYALLGFQCRPSPWLLLSNDVGEASDTLTFHELTIEGEEAVVSFHRRFSSIGSHTYGRRCFGSKDGWLVTLDKINLIPRLFNPVTKAEISLPSLYEFIDPQFAPDGSLRDSCNEIFFDITSDDLRDIYFHKFIVSSNDTSGTVVVIYGITKALALARSEDLTWVLGPQLSLYSREDEEQFEDVCYNEENQTFYAITNFSMVLAFDLNGQNVELICESGPNPYYRTRNFDCMYYIAILSGALLRIERVIDITHDSQCNATTMTMFVFKFMPEVVTSSSSYSPWILINELGEYSIFVGCNQTFSLHHTVAIGIKPNCIYFTDHWSNMLPGYVDCDVGVFDLYNDRIQYILHRHPRTNWPPSICMAWNDLLHLVEFCFCQQYTPLNLLHPCPWLFPPSKAEEASNTLTYCNLTIKEKGDVGCHHHFSAIDNHISSHHNFSLRMDLSCPLTKQIYNLASSTLSQMLKYCSNHFSPSPKVKGI